MSVLSWFVVSGLSVLSGLVWLCVCVYVRFGSGLRVERV
jgi:hypothetical protein